jgi:hypothetical protein
METDKTILTATQFVDLALKYPKWGEIIRDLPEAEMQTLFALVSAAGFDPKAVVQGQLKGHYRDQDGSATGETYPINHLCPFKVISKEEGKDHYFASGWLDCALRRVVFVGKRQGESREQLIEAIASEIKRSVPLEPIQLTLDGDMLSEYPPSTNGFFPKYFVDHTRDNRTLNSCVGIHDYCNGWADRLRATETQDAIVCRVCHLRVLFPREIKTYGELRQFLATQRTQVAV